MKSTISKFILVSFASVALNTLAPAQTTVQTTSTTSTGTISEFSPDTIVVRSTSAGEPIRYRYSKTTTYVDEAGAPVSVELVKSGLPVTIQYVREGDQLVASRVIVRKTVSAAPVPVTPAVTEKTTTTTTTTKKKEDDDD